MSQNALRKNLSVCIFVCKAVAFLRSSAAAHLWGRDNSSLGWRLRLQKSSGSCQKLTPCYISAQNKLLSLVLGRHCPIHRDTDVLHISAETPVRAASPIYHRLCRVTLVLISQTPFFALLWCELCSCGRSIKVRQK